ncbi:MAG: hypothetical protein KAX38_00845, partial [Candidatus Krumholzibacteria bacterium]|nr:hypothetical protein [Candidatus Krumholzibacteria bacterium]
LQALSYSVFVTNRSTSEVIEMMKSIHKRFIKSCIESGEEIYPSLRWEIMYSRVPSSDEPSIEGSLIEELVK